MQTMRVPLIMTVADRRRAEAVKAAEVRAKAAKTPDFIRDGLGACGQAKNADDFTHDARRSKADFAARARAAALCARCPFAAECLPWAEATEQTGVFGGEWLTKGKRTEGMIRNAA
jgi:transcription factor WhiB